MPKAGIIATLLIAGACLVSGVGRAELVDVQFSGTFNLGGTSPFAPQQSGAAIIGSAGDQWNYFAAAAQGSTALNDTTGAASGLSLSFTSNRAYTASPGYDAFNGTPTANLMLGYLVEDISLDISGFAPNQNYSLYVYTQGDDNSNGRLISLSATGAGTQNSKQTNASTYIVDNNYLLFQGQADSTGQVLIKQLGSVGEGDLNGFQLLTTASAPAPTPGAGLAGLAFLILAGLTTKARGFLAC